MEKTPVLIYTDDGRDVDDVEAIAYLAGCPNIDIIGIVTTHMIPDRRAFIARAVMDNLRMPKIPIGIGSIFPIGKDDELLIKYLKEHSIDNKTYEGQGLIECFTDGIELINKSIQKYGKSLKIAVFAPLTDLAKAASSNMDNFCKVGSLYIQGQATVNGNRLVPDNSAYNIKEDEKASEIIFGLQDRISLVLIGKHAAYQVPFTRDDFSAFANTGNPVGTYLQTHAEKGLECFAKRAPDIFQRVFGIPSTKFNILENISNPYDALVAKMIANPSGLSSEDIKHHKLVGMTKETHGVTDVKIVKADLVDTILSALKRM